MKPIFRTVLWLTIFSMAMGYLESAIVVYLRKIYYPDGFGFPLVPIDPNMTATEFWREAATITMLLGVGVLAGRNASQRFAFFIFSFAVWDIFYYVFLKVLDNWPESLFTWDLLFLIPVPWVGPVITPCIVASTMIFHALSIVGLQEKGYAAYTSCRDWLLLTLGSLVIILSFVWDYARYMRQTHSFAELWTLSSGESLFAEALEYVPQQFNWWSFWLGEAILLLTIGWFIRRNMRNGKAANYQEDLPPQTVALRPVPAENPGNRDGFADYLDLL